VKRVVYLTQRFPVLTETFTTKEVDGLRGRGLDIVVRGLRPGEPPELAPAVGIGAGALLRSLMPETIFRRPRRRLLAAARGRALAQELDGKVDHVHAQFPLEAASTALFAARASGATFSFSGHTYHDLDLMPEKLAAARFVTVGSEFERWLLAERYGDRWSERIHVRRLGVPERGARTAAEGGTIASVGTLTGKKGHAVLIRAVAELVRRGLDVQLEITGDGPERAELERLVAELSLERNVSLPGAAPHADALDRVARADVFALACRTTADGDHDCLPVALMDAMSIGVPVVSTDAFGIPELIEDGRSGLLSPPGDHVALADSLERVLADSGLRDELGRAGRLRVRNRFDLEQNLDALAELFRSQL
jgi:glycosyltransferase involved in cell wall biosynthesis